MCVCGRGLGIGDILYMLFGWFSLWEPPRFQASWLCWPSCGIPIASGSLNPSPNSSTRLRKLYPMFGCGSLYLVQWAAGSNLSEDSYAKLLSLSIKSIMSSVRDRFLPMGWLSSWTCHCCFIFKSVLLVGRRNFGLKISWVGWCHYPFTGGSAWLQNMATLGSISHTAGSLS